MQAALSSRRVVSAPFYLSLFRATIVDIRGLLVLDPDAFRWRPTGWYGRLSDRAPAFEVPLSEVGAIRLIKRRLFRSTLVFEDLAGAEIYADGNTMPIPLEVKAGEAVAALQTWGWACHSETQGVERWRMTTPVGTSPLMR